MATLGTPSIDGDLQNRNTTVNVADSVAATGAGGYKPVGVKNVAGVDAARQQANVTDVVASAQDIDVQLAQAKVQQDAKIANAQSSVDYAAEIRNAQNLMAQEGAKARSENDAFNATVDPTIQKTRDTIVANTKRAQELYEESKDAGFFRRFEIAGERMQAQKDAYVASKTYNTLVDYKNAETDKVNSELASIKAKYELHKEAFVADQAAGKAVADAAYDNAVIASKTSSYVAQTEMGVAANIYSRDRAALQDAQEADRQKLNEQEFKLRAAEYESKLKDLDAKNNNMVIDYMRTVRGLDKSPVNDQAVYDWYALQPKETQESIVQQAIKSAQFKDAQAGSQTPLDDQTIIQTVATKGTVGDFKIFQEQSPNPVTGIEAYLPTEADVNNEATRIEGEWLKGRQATTEMVENNAGVKVPTTKQPELTAAEKKAARDLAYKNVYSIPVAQQVSTNSDNIQRTYLNTFNAAPDAYTRPINVLGTVDAITNSTQRAKGYTADQLKVLESSEVQLALRGHPELFTGAGDGTLDIADRLIAAAQQVKIPGATGEKTSSMSREEAATLVSKILTTTAMSSISQARPEDAKMLTALQHATNSPVIRNLQFRIGTDSGAGLLGSIMPERNKFKQLQVVNLTDPVSLLQAVDARAKAKNEAKTMNIGTALTTLLPVVPVIGPIAISAELANNAKSSVLN